MREPLVSVLELRGDTLSKKSVRDAPQAHFGRVVVLAIAWLVDGVEGVDFLEKTDALAGGAFADLKAFYNIVECEGLFAGEIEAVDFAVGLWQTEGLGGVYEEGDKLSLQV